MKQYLAISLIALCFLPAYGETYNVGGNINVIGTGSNAQDNPYQCPNSGDITSISCKGFAALHDDLQSILRVLIQLVTAENNNTAELKKVCLVESHFNASEC